MHEVELRLLGQPSPDGEILAEDLIAIAAATKTLTYRLTRLVASAEGLGRTTADLEALAQVRLTLAPGSTRVICRIGDLGALEIDPLSGEVERLFSAIVDGFATARRPAFASDTVAEAAGDLAVALGQAATEVHIVVGPRPPVRLTSASLERGVWTSTSDEYGEEASMRGELRAVDLDSSRFRLVDEVGNKIELEHVEDATSVAGLVGTRVEAVGRYVPVRGAKRARLSDVVITQAVAPFRTEPVLSISDFVSRVRTRARPWTCHLRRSSVS